MQLCFNCYKSVHMKCSFYLVFIDFTCVLSLLPDGWGNLLAGHSVSDSAALLLVVLWEACWFLLLWPGGGSGLNLWLLGTVCCGCLLVPPPWSAGEAISASVAAVMLSMGSIVCFLHGHVLDVSGAWCGGLEDSWFPITQDFTNTTMSFIGAFCTCLWSWNVWVLAQGASYGFQWSWSWNGSFLIRGASSSLIKVLKCLNFIMGYLLQCLWSWKGSFLTQGASSMLNMVLKWLIFVMGMSSSQIMVLKCLFFYTGASSAMFIVLECLISL